MKNGQMQGLIQPGMFGKAARLWTALTMALLVLTVASPAGAQNMIGPVPSVPGDGLDGLYSINSQNPAYTGNDNPLASFSTTNICFPDCHASSFGDGNGGLAAFTNGNATNINFFNPDIAPPSTWSGSLLDISGFIAITQPGTYQFFLGHDDNESLTVGGRLIASLGCCGVNGPYDVSFSAPGLYEIALTFAEGGGGSYFNLTADDPSGACILGCYNADNQLEPNSLFYSNQQGAPAPTPGTGVVSLIVAAGMIGAVRMRAARPVTPRSSTAR